MSNAGSVRYTIVMPRKQVQRSHTGDTVLTVRVSPETLAKVTSLTGGEYRLTRSAVARAAIEKGLEVMRGKK